VGHGDGRPSRPVVRPADDDAHPGLVVGFQLFGLDAPVRGFADRLAAAGYTVLVPDLYHRVEPGTQLPMDDEGRLRGFADDPVVPQVDRKQIAEALRAAGVGHELVVYPDTPHAFFLPGADSFRSGPAADVWRRARAFLAEELGAAPAR
jgi:dienelactone hydrolase